MCWIFAGQAALHKYDTSSAILVVTLALLRQIDCHGMVHWTSRLAECCTFRGTWLHLKCREGTRSPGARMNNDAPRTMYAGQVYDTLGGYNMLLCS